MRVASRARETRETNIAVELELDGAGIAARVETPNGFFSHMLEALARHGGLGLRVAARGDVEVDLHHTVEDVGLVAGECFGEALGERRGIARFAHAYAPLDEALARAVVDLSGRGFFVWELPEGLCHAFVTPEFPLTLVADFFQAFADRGRLTLHLTILAGRNPHHAAEAAFKAAALALRAAARIDPLAGGEVPSTKGTLTA
jgi:imidazoleglycerol-phosphate dehydratase